MPTLPDCRFLYGNRSFIKWSRPAFGRNQNRPQTWTSLNTSSCFLAWHDLILILLGNIFDLFVNCCAFSSQCKTVGIIPFHKTGIRWAPANWFSISHTHIAWRFVKRLTNDSRIAHLEANNTAFFKRNPALPAWLIGWSTVSVRPWILKDQLH